MTDRANRRSNDDAAVWLLALVAGIGALLVTRAVARIDPAVLTDAGAPLLGLSIPVGVLVLVVLVVRALVTRRTLATRRGVVVVPVDEFDPSLESVLRLASGLSRVRRSSLGWLDRRASAVRVCLQSDRDGRLVYLLEVPARARELARAALSGLGGVELRDPADLNLPTGPARRRRVRVELRLARPAVEPLARLELDPDPLQPFAAALATLDPQAGEQARVCIDLLPATPGRARRLQRCLRQQARRARSSPPSQGDVVDAALRREQRAGLDAKLTDVRALFELQLLVCVDAGERSRAKATLRMALAGFDQLADRNWLRAVGVAIPGLGFLGSDLPGRRRRFDRRVASGLFRPARRGVVGYSPWGR